LVSASPSRIVEVFQSRRVRDCRGLPSISPLRIAVIGRQQPALPMSLSLIRATSLPRSTPQAPGHAVARDHAPLPFEMADSSGELVGPDGSAAVTLESYPRFIKGGFQDYEGLGIKRSTADSKHVPSPWIEVARNNAVWSLPHKVVEFLELTGTSGD
jgi:hypothetical protein